MYFRTQLMHYNYCTICAVTNGSFKLDALQKHNYNKRIYREKIKNNVMKFVSYKTFLTNLKNVWKICAY